MFCTCTPPPSAKQHYQLQSKNILVKALPLFLAQEAVNVPEDIRRQMEDDLLASKSIGGANAAIPSYFHELQQLVRDPSPSAVSNVASVLHSKYGGHAHWPLRLFDGCIDALQKLDTLAWSSGMDGSLEGDSLAQALQQQLKASRLYAELLVEMAERLGTGCMNEVVLSWLRLHDGDWMAGVFGNSATVDTASTSEDSTMARDERPTWFLSFMVQLVIKGFCSIEVLVQNMCGAMLTKVANSIRPSSFLTEHEGDILHGQQSQQSQSQQHQHHSVQEEEEEESDESLGHSAIPNDATLRLCRTMVSLLRLLLLEDSTSNPRANHHHHHSLSVGQDMGRLNLQLTIAEIHALQTQRYSRLMTGSVSTASAEMGTTMTLDGDSGTAAVADATMAMMLIQFQICRDLVWIESCLPLNHRVLHEIQEYRKDWAFSADWLREQCLSNVDGAYQMLLQTRQSKTGTQSGDEQDQQTDMKGPLSSSAKRRTRKRIEIVDRKMMETFQMLVAENQESQLLLMDTYGMDSMTPLTPSMIHQRTLRNIFGRVDRWIFDRCKVEFWLLLDNVMMIERQDKGHRLSSNGSGGNGMASTLASVGSGTDGIGSQSGLLGDESSTQGSGSDSMMMEGVEQQHQQKRHQQRGPLAYGEDGHDNPMDGPLRTHSDNLHLLIHIFFQEFVLSETADKELLGRMLVGLRKDAVEEVIAK